MWIFRLNAALGSLVVTIGFWVMWGRLSTPTVLFLALCTMGFLLWRADSIPAIWAWSTLLLGVESLLWPIVTMVRMRNTGAEPTDQQMGEMLTSILYGLFASIFWLTFSYGIFKKIYPTKDERYRAEEGNPGNGPVLQSKKKKKKKGK